MTGPSTSTKKCGRELAVFSSSTVATKGIELSPPSRYEFLEWPIAMMHAEGFTLGTPVDEDCNTDENKNHRAASIAKTSGFLRVVWRAASMVKQGPILECCPPRDTDGRNRAQKSERPLRSSFCRAGISSRCLCTTPEGAKKECRHHL